MEYYVKITAEDGKEISFETKTGDTFINSVVIMLDTVDDSVKSKSDAMMAKLVITGAITEDTSKELIDVFKWSLENAADKVYRNVSIVLMHNEERIRRYSFDDMFVVDYTESLAHNGGDIESKFELKLTQRINKLKTIETF